jgi:hypothetical protein
MGGSCGTYGDNKYIHDQNLKENDQLEDVRVGEMVFLKRTLKK